MDRDFERMWTSALAHCHKRFEGKRDLFRHEPTGGIGAFTPDSFPVFDVFRQNAYVIADSNHGYKMIGVGALVAKELLGEPQSLLDAVPVLAVRRRATAPGQPLAVPLELIPIGPQDALPGEFAVPARGHVVLGAPEIAESPFEDVPPEELLEIAGEEGDDPAVAFRRTLGMFATGVTIITTQAGDQVHGMTANAFMSVSLQPPLVLISVDKRAKMNALLHEGVRFGVNVLADDQRELSDHFAGRAADRAPDARFTLIHDTPLIDGALAHLVARAERSYWGGDHSLFTRPRRVRAIRHGNAAPVPRRPVRATAHAGQGLLRALA